MNNSKILVKQIKNILFGALIIKLYTIIIIKKDIVKYYLFYV